TVTLGGHVFAQRADGFSGNDLAADGGLNGDGVLLARDDFLELRGEGTSPALRLLAVHDARKGVHGLAVYEHVELDHVRVPVAGMVVIHGAVAASDALDAVMEINEDFIQR